MPMRRLVVTLLAFLVVVPAAYAASGAVGDGVLELDSVSGTVLIGTVAQPAKGALWGQMDKGMLRVYDPVAGDGQVLVSGYEKKTTSIDYPLQTTYSGTNLHFRVTGGKYKLVLRGSGIDLTAVGVGTAQLTGDIVADDQGDYALNGGKWLPIPLVTRTVQFGDPTATQTQTQNP
jgi:hypothetical protein